VANAFERGFPECHVGARAALADVSIKSGSMFASREIHSIPTPSSASREATILFELDLRRCFEFERQY
jgi:hypothetical protein